MKKTLRVKAFITSTVTCLFILVSLLSCATNTALYQAIKKDSVSRLEKWTIRSLSSIDKPIGSYGWKLIHAAAWYSSDSDLIDRLIINDLHPFTAEKLFGATPLHIAAAMNSSPEIIKILIKKGNLVDVVDNNGETPLHWFARYNNNINILSTLLQYNPPINQKNKQGNTVLHLAIKNNQSYGIIKLLVDANSNLNQENKEGLLPLSLLVQSDKADPSIIELLVTNGSFINDKTRITEDTPLHIAARGNRNINILKALLNQGASTKALNKNLLTALHEAAQSNNNPEIIKLLVKYGSAINKKGGLYESTPLHLAAYGNPNPKIISTLISLGAAINAQDRDGDTPLQVALQNNPNRVHIAEELLSYGANTKIKNKKGITAMQLIKKDQLLWESLRALFEE